MKTNLGNLLIAAAITALPVFTVTLSAQDASNATPPPAATAVAPHLDYGASQVLQLAQAKVGDDTLISYVKNSGNSYSLGADQIIYLRQQGVSDAVITAMLNQPKIGLVAPPAPSPAPAATTPPLSALRRRQ